MVHIELYALSMKKTGVNYIVTAIEAYGKWCGIAITPRYNSDGSLYASK